MGALRVSAQYGHKTHGHASRANGRTPTYKSWENLIQRCTNRNSQYWSNYGGSGVKVCRRWRKFVNFLADMGVRPPNTTLGRFGDIGPYCKKNCAWQAPEEQAAARRKKYSGRGYRTKRKS
jgi:hypothetical protein